MCSSHKHKKRDLFLKIHAAAMLSSPHIQISDFAFLKNGQEKKLKIILYESQKQRNFITDKTMRGVPGVPDLTR